MDALTKPSKQPRGRRPRVGVRATFKVSFYCIEAEYRTIEEAASVAGQPIADFVRLLVGGELWKDDERA